MPIPEETSTKDDKQDENGDGDRLIHHAGTRTVTSMDNVQATKPKSGMGNEIPFAPGTYTLRTNTNEKTTGGSSTDLQPEQAGAVEETAVEPMEESKAGSEEQGLLVDIEHVPVENDPREWSDRKKVGYSRQSDRYVCSFADTTLLSSPFFLLALAI
jgi:hypothetical protein